MAWVKPASFGDQRIMDKNRAGTITGFNLGITKFFGMVSPRRSWVQIPPRTVFFIIIFFF